MSRSPKRSSWAWAGGLGAGFILWQFKESDRRVATTGFRNQWQYPDRWYSKTCRRLGVEVEVYETTSKGKAAARLDEALDDGIPVIAFVSAGDLPYWHLPPDESGWWGYPIVLYGRDGDRYLVDDRNQQRLTIGSEELAIARARIPSYKHRLVIADPAATSLDEQRLRKAMVEGLAEQVEHLSSSSDSFSLPAFAKWARMLRSTTGAKAWARVFADGEGLLGALVSAHEAVDDVGIVGGDLRRLYAEFLDLAGPVVDRDLSHTAMAYREAAEAWADVALVCFEVPEVQTVVEADRDRRDGIERGDAGRTEAANAAHASVEAMEPDTLDLGRSAMLHFFSRLADELDEAVAPELNALDLLHSTMA